VCGGFVSGAFLASVDIVMNELALVRPVVLARNEFQGSGGSVVSGHRGVVMGCCNSQSHSFGNVDSVSMVEDAVF